MGAKRGPVGHLQVREDKNGSTRSYWVFWRDQDGKKGGCCLGPAHVRDAGRRTPRGAIVWRAGHGPKPTPEHLTPREAEDRLDGLLAAMRASTDDGHSATAVGSLRDAAEGWIAERKSERGLKRSTIAGYEDLFERLYRDLGEDTPVRELADGRLGAYFADFKSFRVVGESAAQEALAEGKDVREVHVRRWTAQPPDSQAVEVATKAEAERLASEMPGTWKHRRRGAYRVVPLNSQRPRRVPYGEAERLRAEGWLIRRRTTKRWMLAAPAGAHTRNMYRDILGAILDYAVRQRWLEANPLAEIKRASKRRERERILRRDDFYDTEEVDRLLNRGPGIFEEAFWLCGAHAGFRLPGEALGLRWGAVDFQAGIIRPYDNWVRNASDTTKTSDSEAIPMTPRLTRALATLKQRAFASGDADFVFVSELRDRPVSERPIRDAFRVAQRKAALKPIRMYNLRHSFGTTLARSGVDVRTIQALMRHDRLTTTEQYMAYSPRLELADQITRALDPHNLGQGISNDTPLSGSTGVAFLARLEEEIPAKWMREVQRIYAEAGSRVS
jgi:integrase